MAGIESIQCPKCGSPLEVTSSTFQARCSYCGSVLRVSRDASGQPLAVLDDIREDTDILATEVVRRRLEERLRDLRVSQVALEAEFAGAKAEFAGAKAEFAGAEAEFAGALKKAKELAGCGTYVLTALMGAFGGGFLLVAIGIEGLSSWGAVVGGIVGGIIAYRRVERMRQAALVRAREEYGRRMRALEAGIAEAQGQLGAATGRMRALEADIAEAQRQLGAATARMDGLIMDAGGH